MLSSTSMLVVVESMSTLMQIWVMTLALVARLPRVSKKGLAHHVSDDAYEEVKLQDLLMRLTLTFLAMMI